LQGFGDIGREDEPVADVARRAGGDGQVCCSNSQDTCVAKRAQLLRRASGAARFRQRLGAL
jgi:hypothetical protein